MWQHCIIHFTGIELLSSDVSLCHLDFYAFSNLKIAFVRFSRSSSESENGFFKFSSWCKTFEKREIRLLKCTQHNTRERKEVKKNITQELKIMIYVQLYLIYMLLKDDFIFLFIIQLESSIVKWNRKFCSSFGIESRQYLDKCRMLKQIMLLAGRETRGHEITFLFKQRFKSLFMEILYMFAFELLSFRSPSIMKFGMKELDALRISPFNAETAINQSYSCNVRLCLSSTCAYLSIPCAQQIEIILKTSWI